MSTPSAWALSLIYWLHMLATGVWMGSLVALSLFFLPVARPALDEAAYVRLLDSLQRRLQPVGWFCLMILVGSGLFQMSANPHYQGFLAIHNRWALAILVKHLAFALVIALSAYQTWGLTPRLRRLALSQASGDKAAQMQAAQRQMTFLLRLHLILALIILGLTALARTA